jgi:hypothetical protein
LPPALSPPHGDARGVDAERGRLGLRETQRGHAVVHRGGKRVLRAHAVVHRQHGAAGGGGQRAAQHVVRVQVTDDPAAAMEVHEQRQHGIHGHARWAHQPQRDAVGVEVAHQAHGRRVGLREGPAVAVGGAGLGGRLGVHGRHVALDHQVEQRTGLGVEHR